MKKKKVKKIKIPEEKTEKVESLLQRIQRENSQGRSRGRGDKRVVCREAFRLWLSIPATFRSMPESLRAKMGIEDPDVIEVLEFTTQREFGKKYSVAEHILVEWKKEMIGEKQGFEDTKKFFKKLTQNVLGALYREALVQGDAQRAKLFMQLIEDWNEQMGIRHSGNVETHLLPEEKAQLDKLLALNTK